MAAASATRFPRLSSADMWIVALGAAYVLAVLPFCPELASPDQALAVLVNSAPLLVLALGQMFVLLIGAIDLSVSGVISLAGVTAALLMTQEGGLLTGSPLAIPIALTTMLLVGVIAGALHGVAVAWLAMPAFLVTMATMMALSGAAVWITGGERVGGLPVDPPSGSPGASELADYPLICWMQCKARGWECRR